MLAAPDRSAVWNSRQRPLSAAPAKAGASTFVIVTAPERSAGIHAPHRGRFRPAAVSWPAHGEHPPEAGGARSAHRLADDDLYVLPDSRRSRRTIRRVPG